MSTEADRISQLETKLADAERELKWRAERIDELKSELDKDRDLIRRFNEWAHDNTSFVESFIATWGEGTDEYNKLVDKYEDLRARFNKLVGRYNRYIVVVQPIGRPLAASEAQEQDVLKRRKAGGSLRGIAEEMSLSLRTVRTIVGRADRTDRTTTKRKLKLGIEPKPASELARRRGLNAMPRRVTGLLKDKDELVKEAKGLK